MQSHGRGPVRPSRYRWVALHPVLVRQVFCGSGAHPGTSRLLVLKSSHIVSPPKEVTDGLRKSRALHPGGPLFQNMACCCPGPDLSGIAESRERGCGVAGTGSRGRVLVTARPVPGPRVSV